MLFDALKAPTPRAVEPKIPKYRLHRPSGRAVMTIAGRDVYLGAHGSADSKAEYRRRLGEYLASGGVALAAGGQSGLTIIEVIAAYWQYICGAYKPQSRDGMIKPALRRLRLLYGHTPASEFGPLALKAFRHQLLQEQDEKKRRLSRPYINRVIKIVRAMFKWAVSEELVAPSVLQALQAVEGLRYGRSDAPEPEPVGPAPDAHVEAALKFMPPVVADMVRLHRLTGMRPGELCAMTTGQIDTSGKVWRYKPTHHKTLHRGKHRMVPIGPRGQEIVRRYLRTGLDEPLFSPAESERQRKEILRVSRVSPLTPSQRARDEARARRPKREYRNTYDTNTYGVAVRRACEEAGVPPWSPNQLRHTYATETRKEFGLDGAAAVLGHAKIETTQIYAERNDDLAMKIARRKG